MLVAGERRCARLEGEAYRQPVAGKTHSDKLREGLHGIRLAAELEVAQIHAAVNASLPAGRILEDCLIQGEGVLIAPVLVGKLGFVDRRCGKDAIDVGRVNRIPGLGALTSLDVTLYGAVAQPYRQVVVEGLWRSVDARRQCS